MAWIRMVPEGEAKGPLRTLYEHLAEPRGGVDNILKIHSLNPASMKGHWELYRAVMRGPSPLSRRRREMIAVAVSAANGCRY